MASKLLTEFPAVPVSAWRIKSLSSTESPPVSRPTDKQSVEGESDSSASTLIGSSSVPLVPYSAQLCTHIPAKRSPPEFHPTKDSSEIKSKIRHQTDEPASAGSRPDTFISARITCPALIAQLSAVQSELSQSDPSLARTLIRPSGFHLTLLTLHTADTMDNINTAIKLIETALCRYREHTNTTDALELSFRGLDQFSNKVLFASLQQDKQFDNFSRLARSFSDIFSEEYTDSFDEITEFTPHLTLAKTSRTMRGPRRYRLYEFKYPDLINKIVSSYSNCLFGTQSVGSLDLLAMNKPKSADGYYHCYHTFAVNQSKS